MFEFEIVINFPDGALGEAEVLDALFEAGLDFAACGSQTSESNLMLDAVKRAYAKASKPKAQPIGLEQMLAAITPDALAQVPQRVIIVEWEKTRNAVGMIKEAENAGVETYFDQGRAGVLMNGGLVVSTRGFGNDLLMADVSGFRSALASRGQYTRVHRLLGTENQTIIQSYTCQISVSGQTATESCAGASGEFQNTYALGSNGRIQSSRQWTTPEIGFLRIVQVK